MTDSRSQTMKRAVTVIAVSAGLFVSLASSPGALAREWKEEFRLADRRLTHTGESPYFILVPGFRLVLESRTEKLTITVLDETKEINGIVTRVVEEREEKKWRLHEVSRNFFTMDAQTGDVFYFGEEVDVYKDGRVRRHPGAWRAYDERNRPGLMVPGRPEVGMRYYQELAPGVAMDRAEVISVSTTFATSSGEFKNCLKTRESSKIKPFLFFGPKDDKIYAPGIGLVKDGKAKLTSYGYVEANARQGGGSDATR